LGIIYKKVFDFPIYDCSVKVNDEKKSIVKINCTCWNFVNKRIIRVGEFADQKTFANPCKHLRPVVEAFEISGYILKKPKEMIGEPTLSVKLRRQLIERAKNCCEHMKVNEEGVFEKCGSINNLQVHRKQRGSNGGLYCKENCEVLCWECHRGPFGAHSNEFRGCQGK
jgi:hypothetical protein